MNRAALAPPLAALLLAACAGAAGGGQPGPASDVVTAAELTATGAPNLYDALERLRPRWLRVRMERSDRLPTEILVYQDNVCLGDLEMLKDIRIEGIHRVRWLDSAAAGRLPGAGSVHVEGAIVIETSRAAEPAP